MNESNSEPVEISTRLRPGEWTTESLTELVGSYEHKLAEMGAPEAEIETSVETTEDGSAKVKVSWQRSGVRTFAATGQVPVAEAENSRGHGESIPPGDTTKDSQGLGAVYGDAERSPIDAPPTSRAQAAAEQLPTSDYVAYTDADGKSYLEDAEPAKE
ncbi:MULTISPECIES: hypothetical protein [unclassified Arthrobacter]|uniref:hypothetical protein n=1 Tax=unclassified Arthrobacter TaxID=235627 RepID=UPI002119C675|nr:MULTISPECIES: hypothetical protein [unclassified Arthrobacter]